MTSPYQGHDPQTPPGAEAALTESVPRFTLVDGGVRVKETPTHYIDVIRMIYNWRLATVPKRDPMSYDRGWCYAGTGPDSFTTAVLAAAAWDGSDDTEPGGWNKNIQTGEWREPERTAINHTLTPAGGEQS